MERELVSKAEFARRVHRSPGRVSQWLSEKRIAAEADGRLDLKGCLDKLGMSLDVSQQLAQAAPILPGTEAVLPVAMNDQALITKAKAQSAQVKALQDRAGLLEAQGRWIRTEDAKREWQRGMAELLQMIEATFAEMGKQLAAELRAEPRTVTTLLMREWRRTRAGIERGALERRDGEAATAPAPELNEGEGLAT